MVEPVDIPKSLEEKMDRAGAVDVVIALFPGAPHEKIAAWVPQLREALGSLEKPARAAVVRIGPENSSGARPAPESEDAGEESPASDVVVLPFSNIDPAALADPVQQLSETYRAALAVGAGLGARACGVFASDLAAADSSWISQFLHPVLDLNFDLAAPCYARSRFDALLNRAIFSPLARTLYGKQLQTPVGPDLVISAGLASALPRAFEIRTPHHEKQFVVALPVTAAAIRGGFEVCEARVATRFPALGDSLDLSSLLARTLGLAFLDMEANAAYWQKVRGSDPVPSFGTETVVPADAENASPDAEQMVESFRLGWRSLREVWAVALPPSALLELGRLARLPSEEFRLPDELWARIVYDFALAYRLGAINRDHLLRAMTPLYLAWAASYVLEMAEAPPAGAEPRLERLARAYESEKRYLLSRWRWPDSFNP